MRKHLDGIGGCLYFYPIKQAKHHFLNHHTMKFANQYFHTDIRPYEVIRKVSDTCLEVRLMDSKLISGPAFRLGGFAANSDNQQEYEYQSNGEMPIVKIRLNKKGEWRSPGGNRFRLSDKPEKFHDYNF